MVTDITVRTVASMMADFKNKHGDADPRLMLDQYFWSYLDTTHRYNSTTMTEMIAWCDEMIGPENWYRQFNKIWFTDEGQLTMFKIVWSRGE